MSSCARLWEAYVRQRLEMQHLREELRQLRGSRSWRLTAPLRRALHWAQASAAPVHPQLGPPGDAAVPAATASLPEWMPAGLKRFGRDPARPRLLVDVTESDLEGFGPGVQRVTRCVLHELLEQPPEAMEVVPVRLAQDAHHYAAARFLEKRYGLPPRVLGPETRVMPRPGDRYLGLDFCREHTDVLAPALRYLRDHGASIALTVHDLLPLEHPEWFPDPVPADFVRWLTLLSEAADVALCISDATRHSLAVALNARGLAHPGASCTIRLGADALPSLSVPGMEARSLRTDRATWRVLMVGTIEPRKGHDEALDAFEVLWREGHDVHLVIAGHLGWQVEPLGRRLRDHPEVGRRLHWAEGVDDSELTELYASGDLLLAASGGEGYGLPIGEAASFGCRLLLRDIPVFREVAGERARYFADGASLRSSLRALLREGATAWPDPAPDSWPRWSETAQQLVEAVRSCEPVPLSPASIPRLAP